MATIEFDHVSFGATDTKCVVAFQKALIGKGHRIPSGATGFYGDETKAACRAFQRDQGWSGGDADGLPGPETMRRLGLGSGTHGGGGRVASPVSGHTRIGTAYGVRGSWSAGYHTGDDYPAPTGTPVVAVRSGTIAWSDGDGGSYGTWIGLNADNGRLYVYCHLSHRAVGKGDKVKAGQQLGKVGVTGNTTGPHLHFEDRPKGGGYASGRKPAW
ncbi:peptidoglycan DD-metalloendopeptidase family protein [Streptomyces avicenniae]|uniref:peptidoglycan DD-metalloendopeptidase family protein n=1 Tax=Streptomyces avicenniae TaxID=500153 RepID=UPI00069ACE25|nr:peptidoglycan DD-metalloendopeptidase family protein [Streptomyces avicenniae]